MADNDLNKLSDFIRIDKQNPMYNEIKRIHSQACKNEKATYIDPQSGLTVFTAYFHKLRGYCCESGCRHCPYPKE
jgi:hypothetical protein